MNKSKLDDPNGTDCHSVDRTDIDKRRGGQLGRTIASKNWAWPDAISGPLDVDMIEAALEQPPRQDRPDLESLFPSEPPPH